MRIKNLYYYRSEALEAATKRAKETHQDIELWKADIDCFDRIGDEAEKKLEPACGECSAFWVGDDVYAYWEND